MSLQNAPAQGSAALRLLHYKDISEISIVELTKRAGVSRRAFYTHYNSIEELLSEYVAERIAYYNKIFIDNSYDLHTKECWKALFDEVKRTSVTHYIVQRSNLNDQIRNEFTRQRIKNAVSIADNAISKYAEAFWSGAIYSVITQWLAVGMRESSETMANIMVSILQRSQ